jgi:hypothetical protein
MRAAIWPPFGGSDLLRTVIVGLLALAAIGAVLALVFYIGLTRIQIADESAPPPPAARVPAVSRPAATAPAIPILDPPPEPLPPVSIEAIELPAEKAHLGGNLKLEKDQSVEHPHSHKRPGAPPDPPPIVHQALTGFHEEGDFADWAVTIAQPGLYEVDLVYASQGQRDKSESCVMTVGDQELHADALHTHGRENYQVLTVGNLTLPVGNITIRFHLAERAPGSQLRLRSIRLIPAA